MLLLACGQYVSVLTSFGPKICRAYAACFNLHLLYFSAVDSLRPDGYSCQMTHVSLK